MSNALFPPIYFPNLFAVGIGEFGRCFIETEIERRKQFIAPWVYFITLENNEKALNFSDAEIVIIYVDLDCEADVLLAEKCLSQIDSEKNVILTGVYVKKNKTILSKIKHLNKVNPHFIFCELSKAELDWQENLRVINNLSYLYDHIQCAQFNLTLPQIKATLKNAKQITPFYFNASSVKQTVKIISQYEIETNKEMPFRNVLIYIESNYPLSTEMLIKLIKAFGKQVNVQVKFKLSTKAYYKPKESAIRIMAWGLA